MRARSGTSTRIDGRSRLSRGWVERHTAQAQPIPPGYPYRVDKKKQETIPVDPKYIRLPAREMVFSESLEHETITRSSSASG